MTTRPNHRQPPKRPDGSDHRPDWIAYGVLRNSRQQREAVVARDVYANKDGVIFVPCAACKSIRPAHDIEADHIFECWLVDRAAHPECLRFWSIENLQPLGKSCGCHKRKSAENTKARAKIARLQKKASGQKKPGRKIPSRHSPAGVADDRRGGCVVTSPTIEAIAREISRVEDKLEWDDLEGMDKATQVDEVERVLAAAERLGMRLVDITKLTQAVFDACNDTQTLGDVMKAVVDHTPRLTTDDFV